MPPEPAPAVAILMVCTGNICRSPTAEGVLRMRLSQTGLLDRVLVDSAGTHDYHVGEPPDPRTVRHAVRRGIDLSSLRARKVCDDDFDRFDFIFAMDEGHREALQRACSGQRRAKVSLLLDAVPGMTMRSVPDPYFGPAEGFERVLDLVTAAADHLVETLQGRPDLRR